jgi:hypothetical protein
MTIRSLFLVLLVCPAVSFAGWFGPSNYDECVLDSMKGVTSDMAARAIMRSCRDKFPEKRPKDTQVPSTVVAQLDGRAGMSYGFFKGNIYNGNRDWTITQMTIVLIAKVKDKSTVKPRPREYNVDVTVPPLTNGEFIFSAESDGSTEFEWSIAKARGYQSR